MLGVKFGQNDYVPTILKVTEDEVHRSRKLQFLYPWFDHEDLANERLSKQVRLSADEKKQVKAATSILREHVLSDVSRYTSQGRSPPSEPDCYILAFGQIKPAIVATDDLGMHLLAKDFDIKIWHGHELLKKMHTAKTINNELVKEIYEALENNADMTPSWKQAKHTSFKKIFGPQR